jgi:hypothetical protein
MWNPEADIGDVEEWERVQLGFISGEKDQT